MLTFVDVVYCLIVLAANRMCFENFIVNNYDSLAKVEIFLD